MDNFEQIGLIPRSIVRTLQRFIKQIGLKTDLFAIYEFRVSRYLAIASLQCFFLLIICPWVFQFLVKFFIISVFIDSPNISKQIFLNYNQQEKAFLQIQTFSQKFYFETLLDSFNTLTLENQNIFQPSQISEKYQEYFIQLAQFYNKQSLSIIINWVVDLTTLLFFIFLIVFSTPQILILKTFFLESLFSLSETTKCFFLIFFLDLLVGFHSSKSWEIFLQFLIEHFGFQISQNQNFIAFFISTFPVLLDTILKYWIFRYLNKISPSTVATYQAMIE
uniref:Potassium/proton antiporter CemA n=1 Tax=Tydemania expeditionis TaxID=325645 RepID=A0A0D6E218_TYDEX|nr:envelope membrane protein [Tydemania expeditionis]CEO91083.1 envelope membrane protein [Tydemania expeditionis]